MSKITVIVPVNKYDDEVASLLEDAVNSVPDGIDVRLSCPSNIVGNLKEWISVRKNVSVVDCGEKDSFQALINGGIEGTEYFSILEFDDEYTKIWFDNVEKYIEYQPDVSVFLPLEDLVDFNSKEYASFGNEAAWASAFSNEIGYIDLDCLQNFFNFYLTGGVFNTKDWNSIGGLKESMKVSFWYEFLMRATHNGKKVYVIPKVGYIHYLGREGSLIDQYRNTISDDEMNFWFDTAKQEYLFKKDRGKSYTPKKEEEAD